MKKWLVGLVAAGLFAAGALADSVTYTVANKAVSVTAGTAPEGSAAAYSQTYSGTSGQATAGDSMTLTLTGYEGVTITGLTLSMHSNAGKGAGSLNATCGDAVIAAIPAASFSDGSWYGDFSSSFVPITPAVTATTVGADDVEIVIAATTNSLYVESYTIEYTTEPLVFSISLDPAEDFEVVKGETAAITAVPQYAQGAVTYTWGAEGVPGSVEGNVFTIDSTEIGGPYTVTCDADDGTSDAAQQTVSFSIVPAPAVYDVEVVQSEGGTVSVEPASGVVDTEITVTAAPDEGYRLVEILVDGVALSGNTFRLPEGGATVSATFEASLERTATYTVASTTEVTESGDVPEGSSATFAQVAGSSAGQITGTGSFTLTLKGYEGATITGLTLSMKSNGKSGAGKLDVTCGDAIIAAIADAKFSSPTWNGAFSTTYVNIVPSVTPTVVDDDVVILITGSENSLYCQSVAVTYEIGSAMFSVALDPAEDFAVVEGAEATVTATPRNASGEVTYAWTVAGTPAETDGPELALPTGTVGGPYEVVCVATDTGAEGVTATASVSYTVTAAPQAYTVTIDGDIENGSVVVRDGETELVSGAEMLEGTVLTAVAIPATRSYKVESLTVTGENSGAIEVAEDGTFTMPGENVTVSATFAPWEGTVYALVESMDDFEVGADYLVVAGTDAMKNEPDSGRIAATQVTVEGQSVETEDDSIVWTIAAGTTEGKYTLYNAAADVYVSAPSYESTGAASLVKDGETAEAQWTLSIDEDSLATIGSVYDSISLQRNSSHPYFAAYKGGVKPYLFKKVGTGVFSVALDPGEDFDVIQDEEAGIAATPKNAVGEVTYAWTVDGVAAETDGPVLPLSTDEVGGPHEVVCVATDAGRDGETATATVSYTVVAAPALYTVSIAEGIVNGEIALNLDGTPIETPIELLEGTEITVEATPDGGFVLESITVNGSSIAGNTFVLAENSVVGATFVESSTVTATYTVVTKTAVEATGVVPEGSEATFECNGYSATQLTGGSHMMLILKGYEGATITGLTLSMHSNGRSGAGSLGAASGDAIIGEIENAPFSDPTWNGSFTSDWVDIVVPVTATVVDDDVVITLSASANSLHCQSFTVEYEPSEPVFSVGFDKEDGFTVDAGTADSITATARNGEGEITYAWDSETPELNGSGPVLEIPGTLAPGAYAVTVTATDSSDEPQTATADISFEVVAPAPPPADYTVAIASGIENGTVAISVGGEAVETPATLAEGTVVTVEATPDAGYALEAILVNDSPLDGDTFTVAGDSVVSATFVEVVDYATLPFLAEDTPFTGPWQNPVAAGVTAEGLDTDYNSGDGRGAKFNSAGDWLRIKFAGTPGELSYALKGNSLSGEYIFDVEESATGEAGSWTSVASYPTDGELKASKTSFVNELKPESRFVRFIYTARTAGNVALYDVYIANGGFSVSVDKNGFELEQGQTATVTAEAKNGVEPYDYAWSSETPELGGSGLVLEIPGTLEPGDYSVTVTATDSSEPQQSATADVAFTVVAAADKYPVQIAVGIQNGTVEADVDEAAEGDTVTLTATPEPGYKLGTITVAYGEETIEFTTSPASFEMPAMAVLVGASFVESHDEIYVPVESAAEFEADGEYLIVAHKDGTFTSAMKNATNGTRIGVAEVSIEADGYILTDNADIVWKIRAGEAEGQYVLFNEAAGVYAAATKNDNLAQLLEDETDPLAQWTLDLTALPEVKISSVSYSTRWLQRNSSAGNAYFATYTGTQTTPMLFKKAESLEFAVNVDKTGFELALGEGTTVTATARYGVGDVAYVWTSETEALNGEGPELAIPDTLAEGAYTATVTATDSSAEPQTATAEVTFTVVAPAVTYPVNIAIGIPHGSVSADKTEAVPGETVTLTATPEDGWKLGTFLVNGESIPGDSFEMPESEVLVSAEFVEIVKYPVTIATGILNGSVEADKEEAEAGELVTLTATPEPGYKLGTITVAYGEESLEFTTSPVSFEMPEAEALVSAEFVETVLVTYVPVERAADFVAGEEYLLVAVKTDAYTSAMKNAANGSRIGVDEVEIAEDGSISTDNADIVWTIRAGEEEDQYVLFSETAGVYAAGPDAAGNNAQLVTDGTDDLAQWTLDFSALPEVKIASVSYEGRFLQRNSTATYNFFATYTGSQVNPLLFKKAGFSVGFDKEDGFTIEAGTADSITATALRGTEPYSYVWTGDLEGEGATLEIPGTLEAGTYSVTVTATDSADEPRTATADISFEVVAPATKYSIAIDPSIVGGTVVADKETAAEGELVTLTVTPDPDFVLAAIFVNEIEITETSFPMPAEDVTVSATFIEMVDYTTLPFDAPDTPYSGPWQQSERVGLSSSGLGSDYRDGSAKFGDSGVWMQIKFRGTPGTLSFGIKGNSVSETNVSTFVVRESADGENWAPVAVFTSDDNLTNSRRDVSYTLSEDSRYVQFLYQEKGAGNVGIYDVYIGEAGEPEATVTVTGETTRTLGDTFALALALENYTGGYTWAWAPETVGYVDPDTATWSWTPTPTQVGETEVTFSAMDGDRTIASASVTLTVTATPAEPEVTLVDGETTVELGDYFVLQFALSGYEGEFTWIADVGEIDEDGYFTWTPTDAGEFPVVVSAMSGEETIASTTVTLTVTGEPPVPATITKMEIDAEGGWITIWYTGDGAEVWGTDDLTNAESWAPVEAVFEDDPEEGKKALVEMDKHFIRVQ